MSDTNLNIEKQVTNEPGKEILTDAPIEPSKNLKPRKTRSKNQYSINYDYSIFPDSIRFAMIKIALEDGMSMDKAAKVFKASKGTINKIKHNKSNIDNRIINIIKSNQLDNILFKSDMILNSINEYDIAKASLMQKASSFGILFDKKRLEEGKSTSNLSIKGTVEAINEQLDHLARQEQALNIDIENT